MVAITAAMPSPTGLIPFQERFPDRFFDVGIAEQHAVTAAAGMAMGGLRPVVAVYSTFLTRAFDQANLDVGLHHLPVVFCLDRAGITGDDGPSHHGVLDMALLLRVPGMTIFAPSSAQELQVMLGEALSITSGPCAIRFPKGAARRVPPEQVGLGPDRPPRPPGRRRVHPRGRQAGRGGRGRRAPARRAGGDRATVWDVRVVKPLDPDMICDAARHPLVVTAEDGVRDGGAGAAMADAIADLDESRQSPPVLVLGTPDRYIPQAKPAQIHAELGLDGPGIAASVMKTLRPRRAPTASSAGASVTAPREREKSGWRGVPKVRIAAPTTSTRTAATSGCGRCSTRATCSSTSPWTRRSATLHGPPARLRLPAVEHRRQHRRARAAQPMFLHADQSFVPPPWPAYPLVANAMWMLDDFTPENGATRVVPGQPPARATGPSSAGRPRQRTVPVCAPAGHGDGVRGPAVAPDRRQRRPTAERRHGILAYYCRPFMRQQENWFLSMRPRRARRADPRAAAACSATSYYFSLGMIDGMP